jgi:hypothetical protein
MLNLREAHTAVAALRATCWRGGEDATWYERKQCCARATKRFLAVSKPSTVAEAMNVLPIK